MTTYQEDKVYDIIFAGGGTAACAAAGRLAKRDPELSILIIETGGNNLNDPSVVYPALYPSHLAPGAKTALSYKANKNKAVNDREVEVTAGGVLGGGSSINFLMYSRAQAIDYDAWNTEGWDAKSLLPIAKRLENYHLDNPGIDQSLHGQGGPVNITLGMHPQPEVQNDIMAAADAVGLQELPDLQDFRSSHGFCRMAKYIGVDGRRQDAAHCYIHPLIEAGKAPNLHLLLHTTVDRVVFEGNRAVGLEVRPSVEGGAEETAAVTGTVRARKLVVVSTGALATPSILERSGVGSAELLQNLDIPVVSDVPGVGEEYQDHQIVLLPFKTSLEPEQSLDGILTGQLDVQKAIQESSPMMGWNGIDVGAKLRMSEQEVAALGKEFEEHYNRDFRPHPSKHIMMMGFPCAFFGHHLLSTEESTACRYMSVGCWSAHPYSRGNIHITSRDAQTPASFNTGFFTHPMDVKMHVFAYKKGREIMRRTNLYRGELAMGHPQFREGSKAALEVGSLAEDGFKSGDDRKGIPSIEYSAEDDAAIEDFIRNVAQTTWHSLGTCKMAPHDKGGVVDKHLNVHGTENLKIADLSIVPENVGSNTNNTALIIGEKAADIIAQELGY